MKKFLVLPLLAIALTFAGCESFRSDMSERFSAPAYHAKVVNVDQRTAYEVARTALAGINFTFQKGGAAQGFIKAIGPMQPRLQGPGTAAQKYLDVKLSKAADGGTTIEVLFSELVETDFNKRPGEGYITPLRDSSLYDVYFSRIDEALARSAKPAN